MRNGDGVIARCVKFLAVLLAMAGLAACALDPDSFDAGGDAGIDVTLVPISVIGGPGAAFWLIVAGFLSMSTKLVECTLGVKYRKHNADGNHHGIGKRKL